MIIPKKSPSRIDGLRLGPDSRCRVIRAGGHPQCVRTGRGRIVVRAKTDIEEMRGGRLRIRVTEIPIRSTKHYSSENRRAGRSGRLDSFRTFVMSRIVRVTDYHRAQRGAQPRKVPIIAQIHPAANDVHINMLALVDGERDSFPCAAHCRSTSITGRGDHAAQRA